MWEGRRVDDSWFASLGLIYAQSGDPPRACSPLSMPGVDDAADQFTLGVVARGLLRRKACPALIGCTSVRL